MIIIEIFQSHMIRFNLIKTASFYLTIFVSFRISRRKSRNESSKMGTASTSTLFKSLLKTWNNFWKHTSISGLSNANGSASRWRRYLWMIVFGVFTFLTIIGLESVFKDYSQFPVITSVTVKHNNQVG